VWRDPVADDDDNNNNHRINDIISIGCHNQQLVM
jgi:hypothetical protein